MPIQCRLVDPFPGWDKVQPGDMWFYATEEWNAHDGSFEQRFKREHRLLSVEYWQNNYAKRPPLCVVLPTGNEFYLDGPTSDQQFTDGHGWDVSGDPPNITISPSIHFVGVYHGWLQSGVLTDDIG